jgi:hypothetical protein
MATPLDAGARFYNEGRPRSRTGLDWTVHWQKNQSKGPGYVSRMGIEREVMPGAFLPVEARSGRSHGSSSFEPD